MNKRRNFTIATMMILAGLCTPRANASVDEPIETTIAVTVADESIKNPDWTGFLKSFSTSVTIPVITGATTGAICAYLENKLEWPWPLSWLFLWGTRSAVLNLMTKDMKAHGVPNNSKLIFLTARLADWITYLSLKGN